MLDPNGAVSGFQAVGTAGEAAGAKVAASADTATAALNNQQAMIAAVNARIKENMAAWEAASAPVKDATSAFQGVTSAQMQASITGRLLESQLGLSNRALNQVASRSQLLGPLMQAMFPLAIFSAVVPMFEKISEEIISITNDMGGYTEAVQQVQRETVQASQTAFLNPKTLASAQQNLSVLNSQIDLLNKAASIDISRGQMMSDQVTLEGKIVALLFAGTINSSASASLSAKATAMTADRIALLEKVKELEADINDAIRKGQESTSLIGKSGFSKIAQEHANALQDISDLGPAGIDPAKAAALRINADNNANAQIVELRRQMATETMQINDQITENNLQGIDKIKQAEQDHISEETVALAQRLGLSQTEVQQTALYQAKIAQIHQQTSQQVIAFQRQEQQATQQLQNEATLSGLSGDAKIIESANQRADKERDLYARGVIDYDTYAARIEAIDKIRNDQIQANDKATTDKDQAELDKRTQAMEKAAGDQKDALTAAALATVAPWQKAYAQIEVESQKRLQTIQDEESKALLQYKDDADARVQIEATADAKRAKVLAETNEKIRAENQKMTQQLGSDLQSVFDDITSGNIGKRILANMEKLFFQIVAQWILSLGTMKSAFGGLFGSLVFGPQSTGANVFGGGTSFLSSLFGGSSNSASSLGNSVGSGLLGPLGLFSATVPQSTLSPLISSGTGLPSALAGTSAMTGSSIFSASGALSSPSLSNIFSANGTTTPTTSTTSSSSTSSLLSGLTSVRGVAALAPLAMMLAGGAGGSIGQAGGMLGGLLMSGMLSPLMSSSLGVLGLAGTGALFGGATGGLLGFGIGSQHGGLLGSLAGAGSGALTGFMVGGPIGALVGGLIGLASGIFGGIFGGGKRKREAQALAHNTILPDITQITTGFDSFQIDANSAIQQLEQLRTDSQKQLDALKSQGKDVFNSDVNPAINAAENHINSTQTERVRRANTVFGPPQFDTGGIFSVTRGRAGLAWLHDGEAVINPAATKQHFGTLAAINSGASTGRYGPNITVNAHFLDVKDFDSYLKRGGMKVLTQALNRAMIEGNL